MRGVVKRAIVLLVSIVYCLVRSWAGVLSEVRSTRRRGAATVLYYHEVRPEHRARFAWQMDALLRLAKPVPASYRERLLDGERVVAVTFDDGFTSFRDVALPELRLRGIPSTLFVVAANVGRAPSWSGVVPDPTFTERLLTLEELRALPQPLVTIGSHTLTHPTLTHVAEAEARREMSESRLVLERELCRRVTLFSFPHGAHTRDMFLWSRDAGYERVFTILPIPAFSDPDEYVVGRVKVDPTDWPLEFRLKVMGAYCWLPFAYAMKRRLRTMSLEVD